MPFFNYKSFLEIRFANEIFVLFLSNWKKNTNEKLNKYVKTLKQLIPKYFSPAGFPKMSGVVERKIRQGGFRNDRLHRIYIKPLGLKIITPCMSVSRGFA